MKNTFCTEIGEVNNPPSRMEQGECEIDYCDFFVLTPLPLPAQTSGCIQSHGKPYGVFPLINSALPRPWWISFNITGHNRYPGNGRTFGGRQADGGEGP